MDKRLVYIVLGLLVIAFLVGRKSNPELARDLGSKVLAMIHGQPIFSKAPGTQTGDDWEARRQEAFAARVAESKQRAVAKYPALTTANSEMNTRFVYRYKLMASENNPRLKTYNWPELLADDCAAACAVRAPQPLASKDKTAVTAPANAAKESAVAVR